MLREFRRVLPAWFVGFAVVAYGTTKGIELLIRFGYGVDPNSLPPVKELREGQYCVYTLLALLLVAFTYGCSRAERFHPGHRSWLRTSTRSFGDFLRTVPWTSAKRLPWGSPFLVWVDIPVVATFMLLAAFEVPDALSVTHKASCSSWRLLPRVMRASRFGLRRLVRGACCRQRSYSSCR